VTLLTAAVSGQRLSKQVSVARQQIFNNATVGLNNRRAVFYVVRAEMLYAGGLELSSVEFCMGSCEERT
jgi:hypothetical protein